MRIEIFYGLHMLNFSKRSQAGNILYNPDFNRDKFQALMQIIQYNDREPGVGKRFTELRITIGFWLVRGKMGTVKING